jgi:hypothetical protein
MTNQNRPPPPVHQIIPQHVRCDQDTSEELRFKTTCKLK